MLPGIFEEENGKDEGSASTIIEDKIILKPHSEIPLLHQDIEQQQTEQMVETSFTVFGCGVQRDSGFYSLNCLMAWVEESS